MQSTPQVSSVKSASQVARQPRRLSPELSELMHMLASLDTKTPTTPSSTKT